MPGFTVNGGFGGHTYLNGGFVPGGTPGNANFYYNYTWEVGIIMNDVVGLNKTSIVLKECSLPEVTIEKESYKGSFSEYKYAKGVTFSDVRMSFYDSYGLLNKINSWMGSVYDDTNGLNLAANYKSDSSIWSSLPNADASSRQVYYLYGSWPVSVKYGDLTYTGSDVKVVDLTLTYDYFKSSLLSNFQR